MKIITAHNVKSLPVPGYENIKDIAKELKELADNGPFQGEYKECLALHHAQVSQTPYNFFVLSKKGNEVFPGAELIMNPVILAKENPYYVMEGCMSWGFRKPKKVVRYHNITAKFQVGVEEDGKVEIKTLEVPLEGIAAQIFQHEYDHSLGKTIFT